MGSTPTHDIYFTEENDTFSPHATSQAEAESVDTALDALKTSVGEDLVAYVNAPAINAQTGTSYTLAVADAGRAVHLTNGSPVTLTVPTHAAAAIPVGTIIVLYQGGAGLVTVAGAGGVTIRQVDALTTMAGQYAEATLRKIATNEWVFSG